MSIPENHQSGQPLDLVSTEGLGLAPERAAFERWYATTDARWWNTSDAAFSAWCAAVAAERERIINALPGGCAVDPQWVADMVRGLA